MLSLFAKSQGQTFSNNNLGVDHVFIWCDDHSIMNQIFESKGFITHRGKPHRGQGTVGSYILLSNMYIEFISVDNRKEFDNNNKQHNLKSMSVKPEWRINNSSPFGIGLHFTNNDTLNHEFETFIYQQDWMNDSTYYMMSKSVATHIQEPAVFIIPPYKKFNPDRYNHLLNHDNGIKTATSITIITTNTNKWSETVTALNNFDGFEIKRGEEELMTITFDNYKTGTTKDFRPELPLIIKY